MRDVAAAYTRRRPEETTLYALVRDNLAKLYGAVEDGAFPISLPARRKPTNPSAVETHKPVRG
jgi:hypothetical protein